MSTTYWRKQRRTRILGARRRYWFTLAFIAGYQMAFTPFVVEWPL